jgi:preprotein translocase subunit SecA
MAGRGVDIVLGGNPEGLTKMKLGKDCDSASPEYKDLLAKYKEQCAKEHEEVVALGGLRILGTERHESRRIDNQLRGRAGRQGDPGSSRFYLSLEDDLLRIFGGDRIKGLMERLGMGEDEVIEHPWLTKAIANAQKKVEDHNFSIRKHILEYDDVMNQQRTTVYGLRRELLGSEDCKEKVLELSDQMVSSIVDELVPDSVDKDTFDAKPFEERIKNVFGFEFPVGGLNSEKMTREEVGGSLFDASLKFYDGKEAAFGAPILRHIEKFIILSTLDALWKDHLLQMDHLKEGIGLRGYGQKDPLLEYKKEGFAMFVAMMERFAEDVVQKAFRVQVRQEQVSQMANLEIAKKRQQMSEGRANINAFAANRAAAQGASAALQAEGVMAASNRPEIVQGTVVHQGPKVGRNDPCPCGSGKKYKRCCGA